MPPCRVPGWLAGWPGWEPGLPSASRWSPGAPALAPPRGPALLCLASTSSISSPASSLYHSSRLCPPLPPWHGSPFLSAAPSLGWHSSLQTPASHHLDQMGRSQRPTGQSSQLLDARQSPVSSRAGSALVGTLCSGSPAKAAEAGGGPSPPWEDVSSTINVLCLSMS